MLQSGRRARYQTAPEGSPESALSAQDLGGVRTRSSSCLTMKRGARAECAAETKKSRHQAKDRPPPPIEVMLYHGRVKLIVVGENQGSPLVNTRVRSRWEAEWFEASIIDFKYWEAGKYPGEGFSKVQTPRPCLSPPAPAALEPLAPLHHLYCSLAHPQSLLAISTSLGVGCLVSCSTHQAAYFFELKYDTGEFEYVEANKLWDSFEKIPVEVYDTGTEASAGAEDGLAEAEAKVAGVEDGLAEADAKAAEDGLAAEAKAADAEGATTEAEAKAAGVEDGPAKATGELSDDDEYEGPVASLLWGL